MINMKNKPLLFSNLFLHELKSLLYNPSTYLFQLIFITGINIFIFLVSDFFNSDYASPRINGPKIILSIVVCHGISAVS